MLTCLLQLREYPTIMVTVGCFRIWLWVEHLKESYQTSPRGRLLYGATVRVASESTVYNRASSLRVNSYWFKIWIQAICFSPGILLDVNSSVYHRASATRRNFRLILASRREGISWNIRWYWFSCQNEDPCDCKILIRKHSIDGEREIFHWLMKPFTMLLCRSSSVENNAGLTEVC